jgi:hypothetical protein
MFNPKRKRPLGRTRGRCENKNSMEPKEIRWEFVKWIDLAQHTKMAVALNMVMKRHVQKNSGNFLTSSATEVLEIPVSDSQCDTCGHTDITKLILALAVSLRTCIQKGDKGMRKGMQSRSTGQH